LAASAKPIEGTSPNYEITQFLSVRKYLKVERRAGVRESMNLKSCLDGMLPTGLKLGGHSLLREVFCQFSAESEGAIES
jgi:hypothetical protein